MDYNLKPNILLIFVFFYSLICQSQDIFVPYRVGDKFGISNEKGKIILKPSFDILEPGYGDIPYFIGYNFKDNKVLSSFVYNNKVLLADQPYNSYHLEGNLLIAISYTVYGNPKYSSKFDSSYHLYDLKGKRIIDGENERIFIIDEFEDKKSCEEVLIIATDRKDKNSLYIYNNKLKKLIKTIFEKSDYFDITYNSEYDYADKSITISYDNDNGVAKKINILQDKKVLKVVDLGTITIKKESYNDSNWNGDMVPSMEITSENEDIPKFSTDSILKTIKKVAVKSSFYFVDKKIEEIVTTTKSLDTSNDYLIVRNGLIGMQDKDGKDIIPIAYDEIFASEFNGWILKKDNKYGLYIYRHPDAKIIEPVFDMMPLLYATNVLNEGFLIIKLYDSEGKFFCYARENGMLYYRK